MMSSTHVMSESSECDSSTDYEPLFQDDSSRIQFMKNRNSIYSLGCPMTTSIKCIIENYIDYDFVRDNMNSRVYDGSVSSLKHYVSMYSHNMLKMIENDDTDAFRDAYLSLVENYESDYDEDNNNDADYDSDSDFDSDSDSYYDSGSD